MFSQLVFSSKHENVERIIGDLDDSKNNKNDLLLMVCQLIVGFLLVFMILGERETAETFEISETILWMTYKSSPNIIFNISCSTSKIAEIWYTNQRITSYELQVNIFTSCVYCIVTSYFFCTSYELLFIAHAMSYFYCASYELLFA